MADVPRSLIMRDLHRAVEELFKFEKERASDLDNDGVSFYTDLIQEADLSGDDQMLYIHESNLENCSAHAGKVSDICARLEKAYLRQAKVIGSKAHDLKMNN